MKVLDVLEYLFDYKQDKLLSKVREEFAPEKEINFALKGKDSIFGKLLPKVIEPGIEIEKKDDENLDKIYDIGKDILNLKEILGHSILPILLQQLSLNNSKAYEEKLLHLMLKMYNQREQFEQSLKNYLLLFNKLDVMIFNQAKKDSKILLTQMESSEVKFI